MKRFSIISILCALLSIQLGLNAQTTSPKLFTGMESGVTGLWRTVTLPQTYTNMVVVATPHYDENSAPAIVRMRNAAGNSFQLKVDAAGQSIPGPIAVSFIVVEEGVYTLAEHGVKMEAALFDSVDTDTAYDWLGEDSYFTNVYTTPVVLGQVMTYNDARTSTFWSSGETRKKLPDNEFLTIGKTIGEDYIEFREEELLGYIVIEAGAGSIEGLNYVAAISGDVVESVSETPPYSVTYSGFATPGVAVATQIAMDGSNGSWALLYGSNPVTPTTINLAVDEDQWGDTERAHTTEQVAFIVFEGVPDTAAPTPNPATFASAPTAISTAEITMTATVATDESGPVEYLFTETSGNPGATSSVWQTSEVYSDTGLSSSTQYCYTVQMRDSLGNIGTASVASCATTPLGGPQPPTPNPATFLIPPTGISLSDITMTATPGSTSNAPVEYFFTEITGNPGASNSVWQISNTYVDSILTPDTQYCYTVTMRDSLGNVGSSSAAVCGSTQGVIDIYPPTPNPAEFSIEPVPSGINSMTMTAVLGSDFTGPIEYYFGETSFNPGGSDSGWQPSTTYVDTLLSFGTEYCYTVTMRDALGNVGNTSAPTCAFIPDLIDQVPPTPNPATFAVLPNAISSSQIDMTATIATDVMNNIIKYKFDETSGNFGGDDSSWQLSTSYSDTGLLENTQYCYTVTSRDAVGNATAASVAACATTSGTSDTTAPTPDPATFANAPAATSDTAISMTATVATDPSAPVEYLFTETSGNTGGTSSAWQLSTTYSDTGLTASTQYCYTTQSRDGLGNTTVASAVSCTTTDAPPFSGPIAVDNFSFENPSTPDEIIGFTTVPGWSQVATIDSGIGSILNGVPSDGLQSSFICDCDNPVEQTTSHVITAGSYQLIIDARQANGNGQLEVELFGGSTVIGTQSFSILIDEDYQTKTMTVTVDGGSSAIGQLLGIRILNSSSSESWINTDNIQLNRL